MKITADALRTVVAAAVVVLGVASGACQLTQQHGFAALVFVGSALWTAGLILLRWEVWR